jgi:glutamyl-tRNA synthetase
MSAQAGAPLDPARVNALFPADLSEVEHWESCYPPRDLPAGAEVTRFGPSPTGSVHVGGLFVASIDAALAQQSSGVFLLRTEDPDTERAVAGAEEQFSRALAYFGLAPDESPAGGEYGPYRQSERSRVYLSYARELLRRGHAYPCFATREQLDETSAAQRAAKVPPGYWGPWATWRDADAEQVTAQLHAGTPYTIRLRTPDAPEGARTQVTDAIRGTVSWDANRNDAVLIKSSANAVRLPTYHFAHAVGDHLMRVTLVVRGDEWLSSVPLHAQLFTALGFAPVRYAHVAPLPKQIPGGRWKLSKRHDPEASVDFYIDAGYPAQALSYYLRGLANAPLAEMPPYQALAAPVRLDRFGVASPISDMVKLNDISADHIATLDGRQVLQEVTKWAATRDTQLASALEADPARALAAIGVERDGVDNPRKDLRRWSDFREAYGFFFAELFTTAEGPGDTRMAGVGVALETAGPFLADLAGQYQDSADPAQWFDQVRRCATRHGFAASAREYRDSPGQYAGSVKEAAQLVRVALTGSCLAFRGDEAPVLRGPHDTLR